MSIIWKVNVYKADPEKVYKEIYSIGDRFTPQQIVNRARDKSTELHKCFEWDDTIAAEKYRCEQARHIIRMLAVVKDTEVGKKEFRPVRAIVCANSNDNHYEPVTMSVRNEDSYQRLLNTALRELEAFRKKYSILSELEVVIGSIEEALNTT